MFFSTLGKRTDEELMRMIASGQRRAFTELYHRYSKSLLRYFARMLWKDVPRAEDFLHDIFLKVIEHPEHFDTTRKFSTWIFSVAHNMCKNEYRKQAYLNAHRQNELRAPLMAIAADADDDFRRALETAISNLDEDDKHLYSLRYELELTIEEIAAMLSCPTGTVKSRIFHLKKKLAAQLAPGNAEFSKYGAQ